MKRTFPSLPATLSVLAAQDFTHEATIETAQLCDTNLTNIRANLISLDEVLLDKVTFTGADLQKSTSRDLIVRNCDFSGAVCEDSSFQRSAFDNSRMTGADLSRCKFKDVTFTDCKLDMANFRFAELTNVRFRHCVLSDTDFLSAALTDVEFETCTLERTIFLQCSFKKVDLRSSHLMDIQGWRDLKGATIDSTQLMAAAPYLALELGINLLD